MQVHLLANVFGEGDVRVMERDEELMASSGEPEYGEHMGQRLKRLRLAQEPALSQSTLSLRAQVPLANLRRWEQGYPCTDLLGCARLAAVLGVTMDYLVHGYVDVLGSVEEAAREDARPTDDAVSGDGADGVPSAGDNVSRGASQSLRTTGDAADGVPSAGDT